jgi:hypothetical protein
MNRKTATLVGASVALAAGSAFTAAPAAETSIPPVASSYAELLQPIPNAVERLQAANAEADAQPPRLIEAQYGRQHHHHHHHNRSWYLQNGYSWFGGAWVLRPRQHHHHHHHRY